MVNRSEVISKITQEVRDILQSAEDIDVQQNLTELGLDSLASVNLLIQLEEIFNIEFDDEDLVTDNFSSIENICNLIVEKHLLN